MDYRISISLGVDVVIVVAVIVIVVVFVVVPVAIVVVVVVVVSACHLGVTKCLTVTFLGYLTVITNSYSNCVKTQGWL